MTSYEEIRIGKTPSRCFLNETIENIDVEYPVLDLGGGHNFSYHRFLDTDHERTVSVNLPRASNIDVAADAETAFPFKDESFQTAFCFNLLEHLYDYETTISEMYRVLEPGGKAFVGVPFLHRIHGDPHDYNRFTEQRLRRDFDTFSEVTVEALDTGPIGAAVWMAFPVFRLNWVKYVAWRVSGVVDSLINSINDTLEGNFPLYYVVAAEKSEVSD